MPSDILTFALVSCRISYCTADKLHDKVFAYISQNTLNGTLECHAYLCPKRKVVSLNWHKTTPVI